MVEQKRPDRLSMWSVPFRNSIASQLFFVVLLVYLAVSLVVTSAQIVEIYTRAKNDLSRELKILGESFQGSLAKALWEFDEVGLKSSIQGLQEIPGVLAVTVLDINSGETHGTHGQPSPDPKGSANKADLDDYIIQEFDIFFDFDGRRELVGQATVYSHTDVVKERIKNSVFVVILSEIVKIIAIWLIFLLVSRKMLGRPLAVLTAAAERLSKEDLKDFKVDIGSHNRNELKLLEEAFRVSAQKLYETRDELENRMRLALSAGRIATWVWHPKDDRLEFDDHLPSIFGQPAEGFGASLRDLQQFIHEDDSAEFFEAMTKSVSDRQPLHTDFRVNASDGSVLHIDVQAIVSFRSDAPETALLVGIAMDFTDRKRAEEDLEMARATAEQASKAKSEFLASMSHELRTPLNAILGFSDVIREQYLGPLGVEKYREYANDIHNSGNFLLELVGELLDLSAIEAGKIQLNKEMMNVDEIVADCIRTVADKVEAKGIELIYTPGKDCPLANIDRRAIKQVLLNILSNAVKFTGENGEIRITTSQSDGGVQIVITDNGPGIADGQLSVITSPFTRGGNDPHVAEKGWGLGLSISRSLVELHEGTLSIQSELNKGTSVTISLPLGGKA